jgi:hypothetical protein
VTVCALMADGYLMAPVLCKVVTVLVAVYTGGYLMAPVLCVLSDCV